MYTLTSPQAHFDAVPTSLSPRIRSLVELIEQAGPAEKTAPPGREQAILKGKESRSFTRTAKTTGKHTNCWFIHSGSIYWVPTMSGTSLVAQMVKASAYKCGRPRFDPWVGKIPWRRKWQPTPGLLLGKSHGWRSLVGYIPQGHKE